MYDGSEKVRNRLSVYVIACAKLLLDAVLIFFFYDKLKSWDIFGNLLMRYIRFTLVSVKLIHIKLSFREFWLLFAAAFAILYLLMMTQLQVRNKGTYLLFSLFYIFDAVFLMQPTKTLLLFAMLVFFLHILRKETPLRYVFFLAAIGLYGWFINRFVLILIPVYLIVFIWRKSDRFGLRVLLLSVVGICVLYQLSRLAFLPYARPDSTAASRIANLFPEDNIIPHVSYYLLNLLYIFAKLLFPFDVIGKCFRHVWVLPFLQLTAVFIFLRAFWYQIDADWKHGIRHRDVMTQDVLVFLFSYVLIQSIYAADYHSAMNEMMGLVPFYFYLLFESDHRPYKMRAERDFKGTRPVIVCHQGNEDYVYDCLRQAGKVCGGENIILLGDEKNQGFCSNHYLFSDYCGEEAEHFREIYTHLSDSRSYEFELRCFIRHFALYDFCRKHNIRECFFLDSDVLVFEDLTKLPLNGTDFACCNLELPVTLGENDSPHVLYWKIDRLRQFLDFLLHTYSSETKWLEEVRRRETGSTGNPKGDITDMTLLTAWRRISSEYDSTFRSRNLAVTTNDLVFDLSLTSANNSVENEFVFDRSRKIKKVTFCNGVPFFTRADGASEEGTNETASGAAKAEAPASEIPEVKAENSGAGNNSTVSEAFDTETKNPKDEAAADENALPSVTGTAAAKKDGPEASASLPVNEPENAVSDAEAAEEQDFFSAISSGLNAEYELLSGEAGSSAGAWASASDTAEGVSASVPEGFDTPENRTAAYPAETDTAEAFGTAASSVTEGPAPEAALPEITPPDPSMVRAAVLHCHSMREAYTVLLTKGVNSGIRYLIRRLVHKLL